MALEQIEHFDREFVLVHDHRIERHQIGHQTLAHSRIGLKMPDEIAVGKNPEQIAHRHRRPRRRRRALRSSLSRTARILRIRRDQRERLARPHDLVDAHEQTAPNHSGRMKFGEILLLKSARLEQHHRQRVAQREHDGRARGRRQIQRTRFLFDVHVEKDVAILCQGRIRRRRTSR